MKRFVLFAAVLCAVGAAAVLTAAAATPASGSPEAPALEAPACAVSADESAPVPVPVPAPVPAAKSSWTFEGCFTYFPAGPCRDVYRDSGGTLWICSLCGTTSNPGPGKCSQLTGSGYWCS